MDFLRQKTVLIAAADPRSLKSAAEEFERAGAQVLSATGGMEAFEIARNQNIDVVLTAGRLESGDPCQLLSDIKRLNLDIPVILFASDHEISPTEALHRGFSAHFSTTVLSRVLVDAAARCLQFVIERKKKKLERVTVSAQVEVSFGSPSRSYQCSVLNISRGGLFFSFDGTFPREGNIIEFRLRMESSSAVVAEGKAIVKWVRERPGAGHMAGVGVEFTELSSQSRDYIHHYLEQAGRRR